MSLKPVQTKDEARERGRRGGLASGAARRQKRDARATLEALLSGKVNVDGKTLTRLEAICLRQMELALDGDTRAFTVILDRLEGKPAVSVDVKAETRYRVVDFGADQDPDGS